MVVPRQDKWNVVDQVTEHLSHHHEVHSYAISYNGCQGRLVDKHRCEESPGYLSHSPPVKYHKQYPEVSASKQIELKDEPSKEKEDKHDNLIVQEVEEVIYYPVVAHLEPVDLHCLNQSLLLLSYNSQQENRIAHH